MTTKVPIELSSTPSISDGGNATAITIDSSENSTFAGNINVGSVASGASTATPLELNLGSTFADSAGSKSKTKLKIYEDSSSNIIGLGVSSGLLEIHSIADSAFFVNESEKMRITSAGNLGIGTASPSSTAGWGTLLEVSGTTNAGIKLTETDTANGDYSLGVTAGTLRIWDEAASAFRVTLDGSGLMLIGATSQNNDDLAATQRLYMRGHESIMMLSNASANGSSNRTSIGFLDNSNTRRGYIWCSNSATGHVTTSDYRQKEKVTPLADGLSRVNALKPVKFKWKHTDYYTEGFLAHEIQEAGWNEGVTGEKDGEQMQAVDYGRITPLLVKAIQELSAKNDALEARIKTLEDA